MSQDFEMIRELAKYLNSGDYAALEEWIVKHKDDLTPVLLDALSELPIDKEVMKTHKTLYQTFLEAVGENLGVFSGLRSVMRHALILDVYNEVHGEGAQNE